MQARAPNWDLAAVESEGKASMISLITLRKYISYSMYHISPAYFPDIKAVLINRLPNLSEDELEIILEVFMTSL
jgi:hypothetical protein